MGPSGRGFSSKFARKRGFEREAVPKTIVLGTASRSKPRFRANFDEKPRPDGPIFLPSYKKAGAILARLLVEAQMHNKKECFSGKMVILHGKRNPGF